MGGPAYLTRNGSDLCEIAYDDKRSRKCIPLLGSQNSVEGSIMGNRRKPVRQQSYKKGDRE
jgi:hypothetical protein